MTGSGTPGSVEPSGQNAIWDVGESVGSSIRRIAGLPVSDAHKLRPPPADPAGHDQTGRGERAAQLVTTPIPSVTAKRRTGPPSGSRCWNPGWWRVPCFSSRLSLPVHLRLGGQRRSAASWRRRGALMRCRRNGDEVCRLVPLQAQQHSLPALAMGLADGVPDIAWRRHGLSRKRRGSRRRPRYPPRRLARCGRPR